MEDRSFSINPTPQPDSRLALFPSSLKYNVQKQRIGRQKFTTQSKASIAYELQKTLRNIGLFGHWKMIRRFYAIDHEEMHLKYTRRRMVLLVAVIPFVLKTICIRNSSSGGDVLAEESFDLWKINNNNEKVKAYHLPATMYPTFFHLTNALHIASSPNEHLSGQRINMCE